jgi:hypothetical protein
MKSNSEGWNWKPKLISKCIKNKKNSNQNNKNKNWYKYKLTIYIWFLNGKTRNPRREEIKKGGEENKFIEA